MLDALQGRPGLAAADVAIELGVTAETAARRLSRLVAAGHAHVVARVPRPPARRPIALYALPLSAATVPAVAALCRAWSIS